MIQEHVPDGTFVEAVAKLAKPETRVVESRYGQQFVFVGNEHHVIDEPLEPQPATIRAATLRAVVDYAALSIHDEPLVANVVSPSFVQLLTPVHGPHKQQFVYLVSEAETTNLQSSWMELDLFIQSVQVSYRDTLERKRLLGFAGNLTAGLAAEMVDNGVAQLVTARKGITRSGAPMEFENPVTLAPTRTFNEVEQPASAFVLRLRQVKSEDALTVQATLLEADGGAWKLQAITNIGAWLRERLPENVKVIA